MQGTWGAITSPKDDPDYWRDRAEKIRAVAEAMIDPEAWERGKAEAGRLMSEAGLPEPASAYVYHGPDGDQFLHPIDVSEVRPTGTGGPA